jgi:hypothetical protein
VTPIYVFMYFTYTDVRSFRRVIQQFNGKEGIIMLRHKLPVCSWSYFILRFYFEHVISLSSRSLPYDRSIAFSEASSSGIAI